MVETTAGWEYQCPYCDARTWVEDFPAEQPRPTDVGGWRNPAPDAAAPAVITGYHFVMSTADLLPTEAPTSL